MIDLHHLVCDLVFQHAKLIRDKSNLFLIKFLILPDQYHDNSYHFVTQIGIVSTVLNSRFLLTPKITILKSHKFFLVCLGTKRNSSRRWVCDWRCRRVCVRICHIWTTVCSIFCRPVCSLYCRWVYPTYG